MGQSSTLKRLSLRLPNLSDFLLEGFEVVVEDWGEEEGEELGDDESADDAEAEGDVALGACVARADGDREGAHDRGAGGHEDGAEADEAGLDDGILGRFTLFNGFIGKVDHEDAVFKDDADEEDEADEGIDREGLIEEVEGEEASEEGWGQGAHDGDGVDQILVEDAEDDVDHEEGDEEEEVEGGERGLEDVGGPLHFADDARGEVAYREGIDSIDGVAEGDVVGEVEGDADGGESVEVVDGRGADRFFDIDELYEGDEVIARGADVELREDGGIAVVFGEGFDEHFVLVEGGIDEGDLIIGVGVLEKVLDLGGVDVEVVGFIAEDGELELGLEDEEVA